MTLSLLLECLLSWLPTHEAPLDALTYLQWSWLLLPVETKTCSPSVVTLSLGQTCIVTIHPWFSLWNTHTHIHKHTLLHFPKLPKFAKASCLGGTMAGAIECVRPIPTPGTPIPAIPPIITGVVMPIFMLMFIPITPWFTGIPPIPMVPVVIEGGIFAVMAVGIPVAGIPIVMELACGLMAVTWGGELMFSPPKFWANKLMGGTPANRYMGRLLIILLSRTSFWTKISWMKNTGRRSQNKVTWLGSKMLPCCWMILLSVGGVFVEFRPADKKSRLMLTEGSDQVDPNDPWTPTPTFCCCPAACCDVKPPKLCNRLQK